MAMSDKKKKALGFFATGVIFLVAGVITLTGSSAAADVFAKVMLVIAAAAPIIGIVITLPEL